MLGCSRREVGERAIAPTTVVEGSAHPPIFPGPVEELTPGTPGPSPTAEAVTPEGNNGRKVAETWQGCGKEYGESNVKKNGGQAPRPAKASMAEKDGANELGKRRQWSIPQCASMHCESAVLLRGTAKIGASARFFKDRCRPEALRKVRRYLEALQKNRRRAEARQIDARSGKDQSNLKEAASK